MKDLNYISQEIGKGKNLEMNLEKYGAAMSSMYNTLAYIKLCMNYYTVYDMQRDGFCKDSQYIQIFERFNKLIGMLADNKEIEVESVESLRNDIIKVMEVVTSYVDRLRIYEYVLNRIEYRFSDEGFDEEYYNTYMTNDLMHYILSDKDNVVIHTKISEVVEQLPMRLTKSKFYEYLADTFTLYHGAQKGTIDDFAYSLRTTAMLNKPENFEEMFAEVADIEKTLANADYAKLDNEEFERLFGAMHIGAEKMSAIADAFVLLAQLVNDLYTIVITNGKSLENIAEVDNARDVIEAVYEACKKSEPVPENVLDKFVLFEGKQENILMAISRCDFAIDAAVSSYSDVIDKINAKEVYEALAKSAKLQSGSDFVALEQDEALLEIMPDEYADKVCESLINELDTSFKGMSQQVRRAVMATILAQLPVFFNNVDEIQAYINVSLMQCSDTAEKAAVVEILKMIMSDE